MSRHCTVVSHALLHLARPAAAEPEIWSSVEGRPRSQSAQDDGDAGREEDEDGAEDEDERKTTS